MNIKNKSLVTKLLSRIIITIFIVTVFLGVSHLLVIRQLIKKSIVNSVNLTLDTLNEKISVVLEHYGDLVTNLSNALSPIDETKNIEAVIKSMGTDMAEKTLYYGTKEQIQNGGVLITNNNWSPPADYDMLSRPWHMNAMGNEGKLCYTEPYIDVVTGKIAVTISRTVTDKKGAVKGVAALDIVLDRFSDIIKNMQLSPNSTINLLMQDGLFLTNDDSSAIMRNNYFDTVSFRSYTKADYSKGTPKAFIENGSFYGIHPVTDTNWILVAQGPVSDFALDYIRIAICIFIGLVAFIILIIIVSYLAVGKILSPIKNMSDFISKLSESIENKDENTFPKRIETDSDDEVGKLANNFNTFVSKLHDIIIQIRSSQDKEHIMGKKLFTEAQNLVVSTRETASTSQDASASVKEIVATMEDSNILSENISTKIKDVSGIANKTSSDVADGVAHIDANVKQLHEIFNANKQTIDGIKNLSEKIETIWDIVTLINNVADQAKIIAFNAELEASTAGEAGKSFRIVANEIRRLSDGIIDGTREIKERITEIQRSSDTLLVASKSGTEKINAGYENARSLGEKFASIKSSAEVTAKSADDIVEIIQQQAMASEQILLALREISSSIENFSVATDNISNAAENVRKISEDLNNGNS